MADLVPSSTRLIMTGKLMDHFTTFSREICINKSPIQTINQINTNVIYGYGEESAPQTEISYTFVSGIYPAIILYNKGTKNANELDTKLMLNPNATYIKIKKDARDYIKNGKTESIIMDGNTWNIAGNEAVQDYLGLKFYYFELKGTD